MTDEELIQQYRDQQAALNGGCSDGYCVIAKTVGVHTNGGCSCMSNLDFLGRQRVGVMLKAAQVMADRIEQLVRDRKFILDERDRTFALMLARTETAEAKLAKAIDALRLVTDACDEGKMVSLGAGGMTIDAQIRHSVYNKVPAWPIEEARSVLAELEGKE